MSQQKIKNSLINWDLVTVNPNNKNWNWKDLFFFWGINIQSIIGFSLIASLYVVYSLNSFVVLFGTILGALLVFLFSNLIGKPSQKFGLPFVVILRSSLGVRGAKFFGLFRGLVGIFMFGIQTYFLSKAIGYLIRIIFYSFDASFLDNEIFLIFLLSLNLIDWSSIIFAILIQVFLFSAGMNFNKRLIKFSAITVYLGMLLFFFAVLLSDVKFSIKVFVNIVDFSNFVELSNLMPVITVAGTMFAYFSIVILSFGDFSRYVKNETELKKGNLSLLLNLIIFSFLAVFIVAGVEGILSKNNTELEKILTNPMDIIGKLDNLLITNLVLIFVIIASLSTNLIANFIPSQYSLINFLPSTLSVKSSSVVIGILGFVISIFWLALLSQIGILSIIDTLGAFFGPLFGIMIVDFYFIKKGSLINKDIYSLATNGAYFYSGGWHIKGVYSLILGFIFSASTIWNFNLMFLQSYSWIIGAIIASLSYFLLARK